MPVTQELPKYLRGFHKCSREDAVHLAGLIYKAQFGNDQSQLASVPKILRELVPENLTRLMSSEEWKKVPDRGWGGSLGCCPSQGPAFWAGRADWAWEPLHSALETHASPRGAGDMLGSQCPPGWPQAHRCCSGWDRGAPSRGPSWEGSPRALISSRASCWPVTSTRTGQWKRPKWPS